MKQLLFILMMLPVVCFGQKNFESFWGLKMYDSKETVKQKALSQKNAKPWYDKDDLMSFKDVTFAGRDAEIILGFKDGKLYRVGASFKYRSTALLLQDYHRMSEETEAKYGKPFKVTESLPSYLKSETEHYLLTEKAFDDGEAMYQTRWVVQDANKKDILLVLQISDGKSMVLICADDFLNKQEQKEKINNSDY